MRWRGGQALLGEGAGRERYSHPGRLLGSIYSLPHEPGMSYWLCQQRRGCTCSQNTPPRLALAAAFTTAPNKEAPRHQESTQQTGIRPYRAPHTAVKEQLLIHTRGRSART